MQKKDNKINLLNQVFPVLDILVTEKAEKVLSSYGICLCAFVGGGA
jgi:hypothetical protein